MVKFGKPFRTAEEIRSDNKKKAEEENHSIHASIEAFYNEELPYIESQGEYIVNTLHNASLCKEKLNFAMESLDDSEVRAAIIHAKAFGEKMKSDCDSSTDEDYLVAVDRINNVSIENIGISPYKELSVAIEGIGDFISNLIRKLKAWIQFAWNKVTSWVSSFNKGMDNLVKRAGEVSSRLSGNTIPNMLSEHQCSILKQEIDSTFPMLAYLSSDIGAGLDLAKTREKVFNLIKKFSNFKYPQLSELKIESIKDYNDKFISFFKANSILDCKGAFLSEEKLSEVIMSAKNINGYAKAYSADSKKIYYMAIENRDNKPVKVNFTNADVSSLGITAPDLSGTNINLIFGNNIKVGGKMYADFVKDNAPIIIKSINDIPSKIYDQKDKFFKTIETYKVDDKTEATKCINAYSGFVQGLFSKYVYSEVYSGYDALKGLLVFIEKASKIAEDGANGGNEQQQK